MNGDQDAQFRRVLSALLESVRDGTYPAGSRLKSEPEMARDSGVSRSTVAQARRILRHYGLIVGRKGGQATVAVEPMRSMALGALAMTEDIRRRNGDP